MKVQIIEDKLYVNMKINDVEKDIELQYVTNYEQDNLITSITDSIRSAILKSIDFKEVYKGVQTLINMYWSWQTCPFKNEELSDLIRYAYRYEFKIDNETEKLFFDWYELNTDPKSIYFKFYHKVNDIIRLTIAQNIAIQIKELQYTKLNAAINCSCSAPMQDVWDNIEI